MLDRWARWIIVAGVAYWAAMQAQYLLHSILVLTGQEALLDLDRSYVEVIRGLNPVELTASMLNPPLYVAAAILIALRRPSCLPVYFAALVLDLGSWLSYSMNAAYDQLDQANYDWLINAGLLIGLTGLLVLRQRGHFRQDRF